MSSATTVPEQSGIHEQPRELSSDVAPTPSALQAGLTVSLLAGAAVIYRETLAELPRIWEIDPNYSHGYLVPFAVLFFAWNISKERGWPLRESVSTGEVSTGMFWILFGLFIHLGAFLVDVLLFDVLSLVVVLSGILLILGGKKARSDYAFPIGFLMFMAPLPAAWHQPLALKMQEIASMVSAFLLEMSNVPVYRQGCYLQIPGYEMEVGAACSGLRQMAAIVALSLAVGHMSNRPLSFKWALALLSLPIAVAANCIRVTLTGFILLWFGREWAEGVYHTLEGLAIVGVAAALIVLTAWLLSQLEFFRGASPTDDPAS